MITTPDSRPRFDFDGEFLNGRAVFSGQLIDPESDGVHGELIVLCD